MDATTPRDNILGSLIFWSYIVAALTFTSIIVIDLAKINRSKHDKRDSQPEGQYRARSSQQNVQYLIGLAVLSFSVLSYHMLSFLIVSYQNWLPSAGLSQVELALQRHSYWKVADVVQIVKSFWTWSTASTLFQDFARAICSTPQRFWWTQQALLYSFAWNVYMAIEGVRYQIPNLWAYFVLGQILPISFTQNLFATALLLSRRAPCDSGLTPSSRSSQILLMTAYLTSLCAAPIASDTSLYLVSLFLTRILLFAPYFLVCPSPGSSGTTSEVKPFTYYFRDGKVGLWLATMMQLLQTWRAGSIKKAWSSLNESHAVAALGYDLVIGVCSLLVYIFMRE